MIIGPAAFGYRFREISAKREKKEGPLLTTLVRTYLQPSPSRCGKSSDPGGAARCKGPTQALPCILAWEVR